MTITISLRGLLEDSQRSKDLIDNHGQFMGSCVVQSPGAWTRVGPTWLVEDVGWITIGPGAKDWGTSQGLAELATSPSATPEWHAMGISISPTPNLVFEVTKDAMQSPPMEIIKRLNKEALEYENETQ